MKYAPHFGQELAAAGLADFVTFTEEEVFVPQNVPEWNEDQDERLQALIEAHDPNWSPPKPRTILPVAMAELQILEGGEVTGLDLSAGIGAAFAVDLNVFWIFFDFAQEDAGYMPRAWAPGCNVDVTDRQPDYFEVTVYDRVTNEPVAPTALSITVQRVQ